MKAGEVDWGAKATNLLARTCQRDRSHAEAGTDLGGPPVRVERRTRSVTSHPSTGCSCPSLATWREFYFGVQVEARTGLWHSPFTFLSPK